MVSPLGGSSRASSSCTSRILPRSMNVTSQAMPGPSAFRSSTLRTSAPRR
eukprot:CAMPEP_0184435224 /NCGR_PEP_ID=MMETSP0738-20130409/480472_1 /TAXON_ID=385413 /ORGANISM="Thalassiosira miniscula, Strain CCMP1093" /LENGTH=49 /DNA_ID= /DNA_START= /DNA_END= /DNA_ORIENTATION=